MIIQRWQAPMTPKKEQIIKLMELEGLEPHTEIYTATQAVKEHRHSFCEVRWIVEGELLFNVSGYQFMLRPGDRVEIPANTRHFHKASDAGTCVCLYSERAI